MWQNENNTCYICEKTIYVIYERNNYDIGCWKRKGRAMLLLAKMLWFKRNFHGLWWWFKLANFVLRRSLLDSSSLVLLSNSPLNCDYQMGAWCQLWFYDQDGQTGHKYTKKRSNGKSNSHKPPCNKPLYVHCCITLLIAINFISSEKNWKDVPFSQDAELAI